jgi:hypothetical protein
MREDEEVEEISGNQEPVDYYGYVDSLRHLGKRLLNIPIAHSDSTFARYIWLNKIFFSKIWGIN